MYGPPGTSRLTPFFAVVTFPLGILAFMFGGLQAALAVFVVGWLGLVPASAVLFGPDPAEDYVETMESVAEMQDVARRFDPSNGDGGEVGRDADPVEMLRDRYARGEIDETEFERRLEALLETEDVDAADQEAIERAVERLDAVEDVGGDAGASARADQTTDRDPELETE